MTLQIRLAEEGDLPELRVLMARAIAQLQGAFLSPEQVRASHQVMGLDTQLVRDRTYYIAHDGDTLLGSGGWSRRATLYGGDDSIVARAPALLDPDRDAAKVRAMYTDPAAVRRGIGSRILATCEDAARAAGFGRVEMMATLAGVPLYKAQGYLKIEAVEARSSDGVIIPLIRMEKRL